MAKRKRLSPASITPTADGPLETKALNGWVGVRTRAPIADVAGDTAAQSAFEEVAAELRSARDEGRMVLKLPLEAIEEAHLVRDRVVLDGDDMHTLKASLQARGQQTPIEVVDLGAGRYGLISGWRRLTGLRQLQDETGNTDQFGVVQALVRAPDGAAQAYVAMVEENEIRSDLSFYERARISVQAAEQGIYPDVHTAVQSLFSSALAPKRSKISAFAVLVAQLDDVLRFPVAIPEKLGLALVSALQGRTGFGDNLRARLQQTPADTAAQERSTLDAALKAERGIAAPVKPDEIVPGIALKAGRKSLTLSGAGVDTALITALRDWLEKR